MPTERYPLITNLTDFLEESGLVTSVNRSARNLGLHLARIVEAATSHPAGPPVTTGLPCRRRTERAPCPGYLQIQRAEVPPEITWRCPECHDHGVISSWEGTIYDLQNESLLGGAELTEVRLSLDQYAALRTALSTEVHLSRLLASTTQEGRGVVLRGTVQEMNYLSDEVAAKASLARSPERQHLLGTASGTIDEAIRARDPGRLPIMTVDHVLEIQRRAVPGLRDTVAPEVLREAAENTVEADRLRRRIDEVLTIPRMEYKYMRMFLRTLDYTLEEIERLAGRSPMSSMDLYLQFLEAIPRVADLVHEDESEMADFCKNLCDAGLSLAVSNGLSFDTPKKFLAAMIVAYHQDKSCWFTFVPDALGALDLNKGERKWLSNKVARLPAEEPRQQERINALKGTIEA